MTGTSLAVVARRLNAVVKPDIDNVWTHRLEIKSESSNHFYTVSQKRSDGTWGCNCPGWAIKKPGKERSCKHLRAMLPTLTAAFPNPPGGAASAPAKPVRRIK